jgi:hypothetical protein
MVTASQWESRPTGASRSANSICHIISLASTRTPAILRGTVKPHQHKISVMSETTVITISSPDEFYGLLKSSKVVVTFCKLAPHLPLGLSSVDSPGCSKNNYTLSHVICTDFELVSSDSITGLLRTQIRGIYKTISGIHSRPNRITFVRVDVEPQKELAVKYSITSVPTFIVFKDGRKVEEVKGTDLNVLKGIMTKLAEEADGGKSGFEGGSSWRTETLPRGYGDISDQVDVKGLELLNWDPEKGSVRVLFNADKPSGLYQKGKEKESLAKDWIESDTDEQLMMYIPFQATLKIHTLQVCAVDT